MNNYRVIKAQKTYTFIGTDEYRPDVILIKEQLNN